MPPTLDESVRILAIDSEHVRIKKLLIYVCKSSWESEPYRLDYFDLYSLVCELLQLAPTRQQMRNRLETFVRTLSKPDEYMAIAERIYQNLEPFLSADILQATEGDRQRYRSIAQQLQQEPEQVRIKKLIYYACSQIWENDPAVLSQLDLASLLEDLHQRTLTYETLVNLLNSIVQTLNRCEYYLPIAQRIQLLMHPIYTAADPMGDQTQVKTMAVAAPPVPEGMPLPGAPPPPPSNPTPEAVTTAPPAVDGAEEEEEEEEDPNQPKVLDFAHLMDVRLQVMNYCNPLRAKMLLHALLSSHPIEEDPRSWSILKSNDLGELIKQTHEHFPSYAELDVKLGAIATSLDASDRFTQVAREILRALKPYYPQDESLPTPSGEEDATDSRATIVGLKKEMTLPHDTGSS